MGFREYIIREAIKTVKTNKTCPKCKKKAIKVTSDKKGTYYECSKCDYKKNVTVADIWPGAPQ